MSIIKTDRKPEPQKTEEKTPVKELETKVEMNVSEGGGGTISQKQVITILLVIVVVALLVVLSVYFYKKFQKSPLNTPA